MKLANIQSSKLMRQHAASYVQ